MLRWLRRAGGRARDKDASGLDLIPLKELEISVVTTSLLATEPVNEAWASVTGEDPMSLKSNFLVRMEMFWFFLHFVNRIAFEAGGAQARALIQDAIAVNVITAIITTSFDISGAEKGFDAEQWQQNMISDAIEELNEAELDYAPCADLFGESPGALVSDSSVIGRLGTRIAQAIGQGDNYTLRLVISRAVVEALGKSGLMGQVTTVCAGLH